MNEMSGQISISEGQITEKLSAKMAVFLQSDSKAKYWIISILQAMLICRKLPNYKSLVLSYALQQAKLALEQCDGEVKDFEKVLEVVNLSWVFDICSDKDAENLADLLRRMRRDLYGEEESLEVYLEKEGGYKVGFFGEFALNKQDAVENYVLSSFFYMTVKRYPTLEISNGNLDPPHVAQFISNYYQNKGCTVAVHDDGGYGFSLDVITNLGNEFHVLITDNRRHSSNGSLCINVKGE